MISELDNLINDLSLKYSYESSNSAHFNSEMKCADFKSFLSKAETNTLFNKLNKAIRFTITNQNQSSVTIRSDENIDDNIETLELLFPSESLIKIEFNINKVALESAIKINYNILDEKVKIPLTFSTNYLIRMLKGNFVDIESNYFQKGYKTFFILFEVNHFLDNNDLILISGKNFVNQIGFINKWISGNEYSDLQISEKIENRNINCHWVNSSQLITPDYFWFKESFNMLITNRCEKTFHIELHDLIDALAERFIEIVFISIANYTDDEKIKIIGNKTIEFSRENISTEPIGFTSLTTLKSIYDFIYFSQTLDKLILTRNAISLSSMNDHDFHFTIKTIEQTYNSIQNNYNYFVSNNVEDFIDKKLDLEKHARDTAKDLSDEISGSITLITRNLLTLLGATIIAYTSAILRSDKNLLFYLAIFYISFVVVSSAFFLLYSHQKKKHTLEVYNHYSKINIYADSMTKKEFMKLIITPKIKNFNFYWYSSIILNIIFIIIILVMTSNLSVNM